MHNLHSFKQPTFILKTLQVFISKAIQHSFTTSLNSFIMIYLFLIPTANQLSLFHIMNYKKIYFQIIKNRINNPLPLDELIATLIWTFNTYGLSYQFANQYSDEQLKTMYHFVIEKNITSKTIDIFNEL